MLARLCCWCGSDEPRGACDRNVIKSSDADAGAVMIFDWDDTLFPTSYLFNNFPERQLGSPVLNLKDLPCYDELVAHAKLVSFVLRAARSVARVAIVTLAMRPWVHTSAERFLPGLDLPSLLQELGVTVHYATEKMGPAVTNVIGQAETCHVTLDRRETDVHVGVRVRKDIDGGLRITGVCEDGLVHDWNVAHPDQAVCAGDRISSVNGCSHGLAKMCKEKALLEWVVSKTSGFSEQDLLVEAKGLCMQDALKTLYTQRKGWNVLAVGDSAIEIEALKDQMQGQDLDQAGGFCKTVKLLVEPDLQELRSELQIMMVWLQRLFTHKGSFELSWGEDGVNPFERLSKT